MQPRVTRRARGLPGSCRSKAVASDPPLNRDTVRSNLDLFVVMLWQGLSQYPKDWLI